MNGMAPQQREKWNEFQCSNCGGQGRAVEELADKDE